MLDQNSDAYVAFLDFEKAFDRVDKQEVVTVLIKKKCGDKVIKAISSLSATGGATRSDIVRVQGIDSNEFSTYRGLRQGSVLSPVLFIIIMDEVIRQARQRTNKLKVGNKNLKPVFISECAFADDIALIATTADKLEENLVWHQALNRKYMKINTHKNCNIKG